jgi:hypothetical protein
VIAFDPCHRPHQGVALGDDRHPDPYPVILAAVERDHLAQVRGVPRDDGRGQELLVGEALLYTEEALEIAVALGLLLQAGIFGFESLVLRTQVFVLGREVADVVVVGDGVGDGTGDAAEHHFEG